MWWVVLAVVGLLILAAVLKAVAKYQDYRLMAMVMREELEREKRRER